MLLIRHEFKAHEVLTRDSYAGRKTITFQPESVNDAQEIIDVIERKTDLKAFFKEIIIAHNRTGTSFCRLITRD